MSPRYKNVEYIPFDSDPSGHPSATRCSFASAKYAGHLFITVIWFTGVSVGAAIGLPHLMTNNANPALPATLPHKGSLRRQITFFVPATPERLLFWTGRTKGGSHCRLHPIGLRHSLPLPPSSTRNDLTALATQNPLGLSIVHFASPEGVVEFAGAITVVEVRYYRKLSPENFVHYKSQQTFKLRKELGGFERWYKVWIVWTIVTPKNPLERAYVIESGLRLRKWV